MRWILQIAQAFKYLHAQTNPVIHADLNPRNVLIGYDGIAKITDFGLSRCLHAFDTLSRQSHETMRYSPPESFDRKYTATTAHDVYSFAMTVYEILSEVQPFDDAKHPHVIPRWVKDGERPESKPDKIPEDSWEWLLIQACWDQDPTKRPSFEEIVKIIQDHADIPKLGRQSLSLFDIIKKMNNAFVDNVWFIPAAEVTIDKSESLGKGGSGEVYTGCYGTNPVAIKTITGLVDPQAIKMAKSEASIWYTLKHPNITLLYGVSVDELSNPMLIIERAETSLYSRLYRANKEEPVSKEVKMRWILQIAQAFKYLHAQKNPIIHADLNPRKVLIGYDGVAKITDFGLSRCLHASHSFSRQAHGTIQYSPPESFDPKYTATTAHDVYSFAMTIYEILSEVQPFNDAPYPAVISTWARDGERPESKPDQIPKDSWEWSLIQACWDQDPTKRPSFEEIVKIIQEHLHLSVEQASQSDTKVPQDYSKTIELLSNAANQGSAEAQANLGLMYANGRGVVQDSSKAVELYTLAADQGDVVGQFNLGLMYDEGKGVAQDYSKAVEWYTLAANQGSALGQVKLGTIYRDGNGVAQDYSRAVELFTLAANQGDENGQNNLGDMYYYGQGVAQNYTKAVEWYTLAANQGSARGQFKLGTMYQDGKGVAQDYSRAVELLTLAACEGYASAQSMLGSMYATGQGVAQDYTEAVQWCTLATNQGDATAQFYLGTMYRDGTGVFKNYSRAFKLFTLAANQGFADAQAQLGTMYDTGRGVEKDCTKAVECYTAAATQGSALGQFKVGEMYRDGEGVCKDYSRAVELFTLAANQGFADGQYQMGRTYEYGLGVVQDYTKAVEWYTLAANQGNVSAQFNLGTIYRDGTGVVQDFSRALELFTLAANQGDARAQAQLAVGYENGLGVAQDHTKAVEWYTLAANQGFSFAQTRLSLMREW
ncbi:kinase-like domain-containing protein [Obelidium mucronatum]|nr:kinase-like domain-containing protein [Obelidium mucronatum]